MPSVSNGGIKSRGNLLESDTFSGRLRLRWIALPVPPLAALGCVMTSATDGPKMLKDRYLLTETVRRGAQASVTQAFDRIAGSMVAIKRVRFGPDDTRGRVGLEREAKSLQALTHPNIVRLIEIDRDDEGHWLRWSRLFGQFGDKVKLIPGFDYAASWSVSVAGACPGNGRFSFAP